MTLFLSSFAPENVVSRDRFGDPVPHQPAARSPHSRLGVVLTYSRDPPPYSTTCTWSKLPLLQQQQNHVRAYGRIVQFISMALLRLF